MVLAEGGNGIDAGEKGDNFRSNFLEKVILSPLSQIRLQSMWSWHTCWGMIRGYLFGYYYSNPMASHSSTLAWQIPWAEEPGGLQSMGSSRVGHDWVTSLSLFTFMHWEKEMATHSTVLAWRIPRMAEPGGLPSMGSQSRTWLKRLSSSSILTLNQVIDHWLRLWRGLQVWGLTGCCETVF